MSVSMVFCYAGWCADRTTSVMKTLEVKERGRRGFTTELYEKCRASRRLAVGGGVGAAILGGELAAEGAVAGPVSSKTAN